MARKFEYQRGHKRFPRKTSTCYFFSSVISTLILLPTPGNINNNSGRYSTGIATGCSKTVVGSLPRNSLLYLEKGSWSFPRRSDVDVCSSRQEQFHHGRVVEFNGQMQGCARTLQNVRRLSGTDVEIGARANQATSHTNVPCGGRPVQCSHARGHLEERAAPF